MFNPSKAVTTRAPSAIRLCLLSVDDCVLLSVDFIVLSNFRSNQAFGSFNLYCQIAARKSRSSFAVCVLSGLSFGRVVALARFVGSELSTICPLVVVDVEDFLLLFLWYCVGGKSCLEIAVVMVRCLFALHFLGCLSWRDSNRAL